MKNIRQLVSVVSVLFLSLTGGAGELYDRLIAIEGVVSVEEIGKGFFNERYIVMFEQPLDHSAPSKGKFEQRIIVAHVGSDRPMLMVTDGYDANRATWPGYREEISQRLNTNQIFVEHRYFGESVPNPCRWDCLTARNAAGDLHRIRQVMGRIYDGRWISCGASKGGQNALVYRAFYPDDVDATVAYVAPVCYGVEDGRHEVFLGKVGTPSDRAAILEFQREAFKRKEKLLPLLEEYCTTRRYEFRVPIEEIFDYWVLEYSFALWQRGTAINLIPDPDSPHEEIFYHLAGVVPPEYFSTREGPSFFIQAARELGYYGYDTAPFEGMMTIRSAKNYVSRLFLPADAKRIKFDGTLAGKVTGYFRNNDPKLICIYGENDPWTAAALDPAFFEGKSNMKLIVDPGGNHWARINKLPAPMKERVWAQLENWIY